MSRDTTHLDDATLDFVRAFGSPESPALESLRSETARHPRAEMQISKEQGQLFRLLVAATGATKVLEAGTFTGYSSMVFAEAVGPDGRVVTVDSDPDIQALARDRAASAGLAGRIDYLTDDGIAGFESLLPEHEGSFDLAFLDADKHRMPRYCELCCRLLRPGGLVLIDNVFRDGRIADPAHADDDGVRAMWAVKAWLESHAPTRALIPVSDGVGAFVVPN
ncbi:MAG: O-methyltransferase [Phycisphaerales bacterium JB040]